MPKSLRRQRIEQQKVLGTLVSKGIYVPIGKGYRFASSESLKKDNSYNVVFEYTENAGGYKGIRTWSCWPTQEHFKAWKERAGEALSDQKIIAEGVTDAQAVRISQATPLENDILAAIEEAKDSKGMVHPEIFELSLTNALFARAWGQRGTPEEKRQLGISP